jgi:hypothetical protein
MFGCVAYTGETPSCRPMTATPISVHFPGANVHHHQLLLAGASAA